MERKTEKERNKRASLLLKEGTKGKKRSYQKKKGEEKIRVVTNKGEREGCSLRLNVASIRHLSLPPIPLFFLYAMNFMYNLSMLISPLVLSFCVKSFHCLF